MLEKPNLSDQQIIDRFKADYGLQVSVLTFLPLGADVNTAVYRVETETGVPFFLKLRKGDLSEIAIAIPHFLKSQGLDTIIAPLETLTHQHWGSLGPYKLILYPFIEGQNGYEVGLSKAQWLTFGKTMSRIHTAQVPEPLAKMIPRETFSAVFREQVKQFQGQVEGDPFTDVTALKVVDLMKTRKEDIDRLVSLGDQLAGEIQTRQLDFVLCHADLHAGNLLIPPMEGWQGEFYLVDWDNPIFAPKERDLALIGGSPVWSNQNHQDLFYQGYFGNSQRFLSGVDQKALAYYRIERIVQDIAAFCEQLLLTTEGGEDREQSFYYLSSSFLPGRDVDLALKSLE